MGSGGLCGLCHLLGRQDTDVAALAAFILEADDPGNAGKQRIVFASADVEARLMGRAALADKNSARVHELSREALDAQSLSLGVAPIGGGAATFLVWHGIFLSRRREPDEGLYRNVVDLHGSIVLPVAANNLVLFGPAVFHDRQLRVTPLFDDLANDLGLRGLRAGQQLLLVGANRQDIFKGDLAANLAGQALDLDSLARCDTVLLVATADQDRKSTRLNSSHGYIS